MKRIIVWVVLLAGVVTTFNSCDKEPDPLPAIVGTWLRDEYEFSEIPETHSYWDELTTPTLLPDESGYTFIFNADGTYTRSFSPYMNDHGTWELDGTKLTLTVKGENDEVIDDLEFMEAVGFLGPEFEVEGEISEVRMVFSVIKSFELCSNASIAAHGGNTADVPDEDVNGNHILDAGEDLDEDGVLDDEWLPVDVTLLTKFNKLN